MLVRCFGECHASDDCPFPNGLPPLSSEHTRKRKERSPNFMGLWDKETALKIAKCLKKHGIHGIRCRGRGPRDHSRPWYNRDLQPDKATHIAIYVNVQDQDNAEDESTDIRGITRIEALKRELIW